MKLNYERLRKGEKKTRSFRKSPDLLDPAVPEAVPAGVHPACGPPNCHWTPWDSLAPEIKPQLSSHSPAAMTIQEKEKDLCPSEPMLERDRPYLALEEVAESLHLD